MSLANYAKLDPSNASTFQRSGDAQALQIDGVVDFSYTNTGTTGDATSDGIGTVQGIYADDAAVDITFNLRGPFFITSNDIQYGDCGSLVLKMIPRACGDGEAETGVTLTSAESATVVNVDFTAPHGGDSAGTITFRVGNSTGASIFAIS